MYENKINNSFNWYSLTSQLFLVILASWSVCLEEKEGTHETGLTMKPYKVLHHLDLTTWG